VLRASAIIEKAGIPSASLICDGFGGQASAIRGGLGVPDLPVTRIAGHPDSQTVDELSQNLVDVTVPQIIEHLTESPPASYDETGSVETANSSRIVARGSFDEINQFFEAQQWSDGLPIVPPTRDRVAAFFAHSSEDPDRELGVLQPSGRLATTRNVAVNGVMANCRPEYMPVLVAVAEALVDPDYGVQHSGDTTGGEALAILSGPAAKTVGFNFEGGALRDGYRANTSVGRFIRLFLRNVAGSRLGGADKSTFGNTWRVVLAENYMATQEFGWSNLTVDQGFGAEDSTVTLARYTGGGIVGSVYGRTADQIVPYLADGLVRQMSWEYAFTVGFAPGTARPLLVLSPQIVKTLFADGVGKDQLRTLLFEHARIPARKMETYIGPWCNLVSGRRTLARLVADGAADPVFRGDDPDRLVPIAARPEHFMIVVSGDPFRSNAYAFGHNGMHGFPTTKKVRMP